MEVACCLGCLGLVLSWPRPCHTASSTTAIGVATEHANKDVMALIMQSFTGKVRTSGIPTTVRMTLPCGVPHTVLSPARCMERDPAAQQAASTVAMHRCLLAWCLSWWMTRVLHPGLGLAGEWAAGAAGVRQ